MEYPKINTIWKRDANHKIIEGDYSCPEFAAIDKWEVQEKIDGTNIRIYVSHVDNNHVTVKGRTDKADVNNKIIDFVQAKKLDEKLIALKSNQIILYGEGFGAGIQSGGIYRKDIAFILFDAYMNGRWSTRAEVLTLAQLFEFETPFDFGLLTTKQIIELVKMKPFGGYGKCDYEIEGVIARSEPLMRFNDRSANPIVWKLKVRDFK